MTCEKNGHMHGIQDHLGAVEIIMSDLWRCEYCSSKHLVFASEPIWKRGRDLVDCIYEPDTWEDAA